MNTHLWPILHKLFGAFVLLVFGIGTAFSNEAGQIILAEGDSRVDSTPAKVGNSVHEGSTLTTGADGYVYIKTIDKGLLILRPHSTAVIVAYRTDPEQPANGRFKIELRQGVARSISGEAVKEARQNFRFNTPVAAIGVRGTDFTVFADQQTTRVAVVQGGVVVSSFGGMCAPEGGGPCEGKLSRELYADQVGRIIQVNRGQAEPLILRGNIIAPDVGAQPHSEEPGKTGAANISAVNTTTDPNLTPLKLSTIDRTLVLPARTTPDVAPLIWGRWESVIGQAQEIDIAAALKANELIATGGGYALLRNREGIWQRPEQTNMSFALQGAQATILNEASGKISAADVENGKLQLDFAKSTFATQIDLVNQTERFKLQAKGGITADGRLAGESQFLHPTNMAVQGVINVDNASAAYLFQSRIDDKRVASGATYWAK